MEGESEGQEIDVEGLEHELIQILKSDNQNGRERVKNKVKKVVEENVESTS